MEMIANWFLLLLAAAVGLWLVWPRKRIPEGGRFSPERAAVFEALAMHEDMVKGRPLKTPSVHLQKRWPKGMGFAVATQDFPDPCVMVDDPEPEDASQFGPAMLRGGEKDAAAFYNYLALRWPRFVQMERMRKDAMAFQMALAACMVYPGSMIYTMSSHGVQPLGRVWL